MSEKERKYDVEIAQSDKKASTAVDSFKVRKSGNSSIVTIPNVIKGTLDVTDGEEIQYVTVKDENNESMVFIRKVQVENKEIETKASEERLDETLNELDDILQTLVEL